MALFACTLAPGQAPVGNDQSKASYLLNVKEREVAVLIDRAVGLVAKGKFVEAKRLLASDKVNRSSKLSQDSQAALIFVDGLINDAAGDQAGAKRCFEKVRRRYPASVASMLAKDWLSGKIKYSPRLRANKGLSNSDIMLNAEITKASGSTGSIANLAAMYSKVLDMVERNPDSEAIVSTVLGFAERLEAAGQIEEAYKLLKTLIKRNVFAANEPSVLIEHAFLANYAGDTELALSSIDRATKHKLSDRLEARATFAKAISMRDMHELDKAQALLSRAVTLAKRSNQEDLVRLASELRSPGHSLDPKAAHRPLQSKASQIVLIMCVVLGVSFVGFLGYRWIIVAKTQD